VTAGCTTKANANRQAKLAYLAGQQQAQANMVKRPAHRGVRVHGNVRNPENIWEDGLTLGARDCGRRSIRAPDSTRDRGDPAARTIFVVDPNILLRGDDMPVERVIRC
jgi:hypothetical protein